MLEEYNNLIYSLLSVFRPHSVCLLYADTSETTDSSPLYSSTVVITAVTFGMAVYSCVLLLAAICFCVIMMRKKTLKKKSGVSQHMAAVSQQEEQGPQYGEIPMQNYPFYHTLEPPV